MYIYPKVLLYIFPLKCERLPGQMSMPSAKQAASAGYPKLGAYELSLNLVLYMVVGGRGLKSRERDFRLPGGLRR